MVRCSWHRLVVHLELWSLARSQAPGSPDYDYSGIACSAVPAPPTVPVANVLAHTASAWDRCSRLPCGEPMGHARVIDPPQHDPIQELMEQRLKVGASTACRSCPARVLAVSASRARLGQDRLRRVRVCGARLESERHSRPHTLVCQQKMCHFHTRCKLIEHPASEDMTNFLGHKAGLLPEHLCLQSAWKLWVWCQTRARP